MFGFSLGKLLVFLALIVVSWGLFSSRFRWQGKKVKDRRFSGKTHQDRGDDATATLILCKKCGSYHVEGECSKGDET